MATSTTETTAELAHEAARLWDEGELVVIPTETVYGLAGAALHDIAIAALRRFAGSEADQAFTVHLAEPEQAQRYVPLSRGMAWAVSRLLPGPMTLWIEVTRAEIEPKLKAAGLSDAAIDRVYNGDAISLRCPNNSMTREVLAAAPGPIVATGVRRAGGNAAVEPEKARKAAGAAASLLIDGGRCRYAKPSTIVRLTPGPGDSALPHARVERVGVYDERMVRRLLTWTVFFVCSGNTCRSPMAEALAREVLAKHRGVAPAELATTGIQAASAGVAAGPGAPASAAAATAMQQQGLDLTRHRSRPLTKQLIREADMILTMTEAHRDGVLAIEPGAASKTARLDPDQDIADPIGADLSTYQHLAQRMRQCLDQRLKESNL
jgi:tRNA threonylcarbamoyl adenosine modification protein (Sua5/YciO/YrdC/YwlC family)